MSYARAPEPKVQGVDLNQKLRALVDFHNAEFQEQDLSLRFYPGAKVGQITCDCDHVQAAVGNLMRNAKDATSPGGEILVSTVRDDAFVTIRVTDTGEGIEREQAARVLEPYFSTKKGGTGLGLPTVRRVAEEHGGTLTLQSEPGKGTQFMLRLPVRGLEQAPDESNQTE